MNTIKRTIFNFLIVFNLILKSETVYVGFKSLTNSLNLETQKDLNLFYNEAIDISLYFKNKTTPYIVDEYYKHINDLRSYRAGQFLHIHPSWVLVSNSVIEERNLKIGQTYQVNPLNILSPKFKIEDIQNFKFENNNARALSLIKISNGKEIPVNDYAPNLAEQLPIKLFVGDPNRIKTINKTYDRLDKMIMVLGLINQGTRYTYHDLDIALKEIENLINLASSYPGSKKMILQLNKLKATLVHPKPNVGSIYKSLIKLRPKIRTQALLYEFIYSLHNHTLFLASPHSHTKNNEFIYSHSYVPAFCRLNPKETSLEKNIDKFFKKFTKKDNAKKITLFMFQKDHHVFTHENHDIVPFEFLTVSEEDNGQPIFAYDQKTQQYFLVSLNQIPMGQTTTVPILIYPDILHWIINTTKDDYFTTTYPELTLFYEINTFLSLVTPASSSPNLSNSSPSIPKPSLPK